MVVLVAGLAVFINLGTYDMAAGVVVALLIVVVSVPLLRRLGMSDSGDDIFWVLVVALLAKLAFSLARYWMVNRLYGGSGDSNQYDADGWAFAEAVRGGQFIPNIAVTDSAEGGTATIVRLTGYIYAVVGRSKFAAFFVYSWMAFWGCVLFWRAAKRAFPEMDLRRYMYLVLFWPSLLFWPSSVGKDAVMLLLLGITTYGAAVVLSTSPKAWGLVPFAAGVGGMLLIRTHVALMAVLAVAVATAFAFIGGTRGDSANQ